METGAWLEASSRRAGSCLHVPPMETHPKAEKQMGQAGGEAGGILLRLHPMETWGKRPAFPRALHHGNELSLHIQAQYCTASWYLSGLYKPAATSPTNEILPPSHITWHFWQNQEYKGIYEEFTKIPN
jgi:hypothetical protein